MSDMRDDIQSAISAVTPPGTAPVQQTPSTPATPPVTPAIEAPGTPGKVRDALGRFVSAAGNNEPVVEAPATPPVGEVTPPLDTPASPAAPPVGEVTPPVTAAPTVPAPVSWTPAAREEWATLGPAARAEVIKRETEVQRVMQESASARSIANQFSEAVTPYLPRMRMQGVNPIQAFVNLANVEMTLGTGTVQQKAQTIAELIRMYGVDIAVLDTALASQPGTPSAGNGSPSTPPDVQELIRRELAPVRDFMSEISQRRAQIDERGYTEAQTVIEDFAKTHEFFEDVRPIMADLIEVAAKNKRSMSTQEAYDIATTMHPGVATVLKSRGTRQQASELDAVAQRAKAAATGIGRPKVLGDPDGLENTNTIREALMASIENLGRV